MSDSSDGPNQATGTEKAPAPRRRRPLWMAALAALITFLGVYGAYSRQQNNSRSSDTPESPSGLFIESQAAGTSLTAVGRIRGGDVDCTAWLVDPGTATGASPTPAPDGAQAAYAVTAGRCVGITDSRTIITNRAVSNVTVEFNAFAPLTSAVLANVVPAPVSSIVWASMRWTDLAVLQLGTTYGELAGRGVRPIRPVAVPAVGEQILVAGVPTAGIPDEQKYLRGRRCNIRGTAEVVEFRWVWPDLTSTDCEGIRGGSEGSVAFNVAGEAVAMVTTTTLGSDSGEACYLHSPCEATGAGNVQFARNTTYVTSVEELSTCFREGVFRLGGDCPLESAQGVVPAVTEARAGRPGSVVPVHLEGEVPEGTTVASIQGPLGDVDCRASRPSGDAAPSWSRPVASADWSLSVRLPSHEGWTLACAGSPEHATAIVLHADSTPPDAGTITLTQTPVQGGVQVEPVFDPPNLSAFRWVSGPRGAMDCAHADGFTDYTRVPATIQADDLPATVCVIGIDDAGNESSPAAIDVR